MKKRHLTPAELCKQLKQVARESRMSIATPWTASGIICGYALYKSEGFKGKRIAKITTRLDELDKEYYDGKLDIKELSQKLFDRAEITFDYQGYTEEDINAKKGTFDYAMTKIQLEPHNNVLRQTTRYMVMFFYSLWEVEGFGKTRLYRVQNEINEMLKAYQENNAELQRWQGELLDKAGIYYEMPSDPLKKSV